MHNYCKSCSDIDRFEYQKVKNLKYTAAKSHSDQSLSLLFKMQAVY